VVIGTILNESVTQCSIIQVNRICASNTIQKNASRRDVCVASITEDIKLQSCKLNSLTAIPLLDSILNFYFLFTTCFHPRLHFVTITTFKHSTEPFKQISSSVRVLDTDTFLPCYTMAILLSTGEALFTSHMISNINMVSEIRTLKDPSGILRDVK